MATLRLGSKVICPIKIVKDTTANLTVIPRGVSQTIISNLPVYNTITVAPISSAVDGNIVPGNIRQGANILGVMGTYQTPAPARCITKLIDNNGNLINSSRVIDLEGITTISSYALAHAYYRNSNIFGVIDFSDVTTIDSYGMYNIFYNSSNIIEVDLSSLMAISRWGLTSAFGECTSLEKVYFDSLTSIASDQPFYHAFYGCTSLTMTGLNNLITVNGRCIFQEAFSGCDSLTTTGLNSLTTIDGDDVFQHAFSGCDDLTDIGLNSLVSINATSGSFGCEYMFRGCASLEIAAFPALTTIGNKGLYHTFEGCTNLKHIYFPALTAAGLGSVQTQFNYMLKGVTGCTVHFPSNLQSTIGSWTDVTTGFNGTNTTVLFDLPAYGRDTRFDLEYNPTTGGYTH